MGWIGSDSQLYDYLRTVNCDRSFDDKFHIAGVVSFLGMDEEFVVSDDAVYFVDGKAYSLAAGLIGMGYGMSIKVF